MIPFLPKQVTIRAILVYYIALVLVSVTFFRFAMRIGYFVLGVIFVSGFFLLTEVWSQNWRAMNEKHYIATIFGIAALLRMVWVVASYVYYYEVTGIPFEVATADARAYHIEAEWLAASPWSTAWRYFFGEGGSGVSDVGYPLYLTVIYKLFGPIIIIPRIIKTLLSAWMCILVYRLSGRTFGEPVGRMAGIMCALMPNLIIYCGYHLKETEMLFLEVAFLERTDYLLRNYKYNIWTISLPMLLAGSLFFFRTVLGAAAIFAFATAVLVSNTPSMKKGWKRTAIIGWSLLCVAVAGGGTIMTEVEGYWEQKDTNVVNKRLEQTSSGNQWAKYATSSVMAPMIVALPFATMVEADELQVAQETKHGGNYIRNFMAFFAILAMYEAIRQKKWRDYAMIGAFVFSYLGVVALSGFSNSERFLLPGLPCLIMMWAYGVSTLRAESWRLMTPWCAIVVLMEVGWAYFKLGSRGLF